MIYKGAVPITFAKGETSFALPNEPILALYNNDMSVTAAVSVRYQTGEKARVNVGAGQWHHAMVLEVYKEGTSIGPAGLLAYR